METLSLERKSVRPYENKDEYILAMVEDLAEWLNVIYKLELEAESFFDCIDDGVLLCKHANYVGSFLFKDQQSPQVSYRSTVKRGTFAARDNVSNFICWCRDIIEIGSSMLFETNDLVLRSSEHNVILCLLEVARKGARYGIVAPLIIQMEQEIEGEIKADKQKQESNLKNTQNSPTTQKIKTVYSNRPEVDLRSLDEMVRDLVKKCTCPQMFPMQRISEGRYKIGDTMINIFVRILRYHVMVRIGGGWDTLENYLNRYDPCRCKEHSSNSNTTRRSSVFCSKNKDDTDYSKVQSRIDTGSSRTFKTPVKSEGMPTIASSRSCNKKVSTSLDTRSRSDRHSVSSDCAPSVCATAPAFMTPQQRRRQRQQQRPRRHSNAVSSPEPRTPDALFLRRSSDGRHSLATPVSSSTTPPTAPPTPSTPSSSSASTTPGIKASHCLPVVRSPSHTGVKKQQPRRIPSPLGSDIELLPNASFPIPSSSETSTRDDKPSKQVAKKTTKSSQEGEQSTRSSNARMARQLEELRRGSESNASLGTPKADAELNMRMQKLFDEYMQKEIYGDMTTPQAGTPRTESSRRAAVDRISRARADKAAKLEAARTPLMPRRGSRTGSAIASRTGSALASRAGSTTGSRAGSVVGGDSRNASRPSSRADSRCNSRSASCVRGQEDSRRGERVAESPYATPTARRKCPPTPTLRPRLDKSLKHQPPTRIPCPVVSSTSFASSSAPPPGVLKRFDSGVDINNVSPTEGSLNYDDLNYY